VESARKGIATALKVSNPSLGHLASYARIAIHLGKFSPQLRKWRTARAIKLRTARRLR
jgi:hypothetical protein